MENEEKLREELSKLLDRLTAMEPKSDDYYKICERIEMLQKILNQETSRTNSVLELKQKDKQISIENDKIEIEVLKNEIQKQEIESRGIEEKKGFWRSIGIEIVKGVVGAGFFVFASFLTIAANNSGEQIPGKLMDFVSRKRF